MIYTSIVKVRGQELNYLPTSKALLRLYEETRTYYNVQMKGKDEAMDNNIICAYLYQTRVYQ